MISKGKTFMKIQNKYDIESKNLLFLIKDNQLRSQDKTKIKDSNNQVYILKKFDYLIDKEILKAEDLLVITNYNLPNSDRFYFADAIFNLKNRKFSGREIEINIHKMYLILLKMIQG